jgi:PAS domain S-box-containing protein
VIEFATRRLAASRPPLEALPVVLKRLAADFGGQAALAFSMTDDPLSFGAAAYPADAAAEALLAELKALTVVHARTAASGGSFTARIGSAGPDARTALVAFSAPGSCERTCALALTGPAQRWDGQVRSALRTLASVLGGAVSRSEMISHPLAGELRPGDGDARFRLLSRVAPVGIVQFDARGQCTYVNDRLCEWTGISREGALGHGWAEAIHPDDISRVEAEAITAMGNGTELRTDCRVRGFGGPPRWVNAVVMPLLGVHDQVDGYLAALTDVSERKQRSADRERLLASEKTARRSAETARRELSSMIAHLHELDELKTQFLATVSHELRTPLTSIISFTDLILGEERSLSDESAEFLGIIERNAEQLLRLVGDLMLLSGLEAGVITLHVDDVCVPDLVRDAVATGSVEAGKRGVTLTGVADSGLPALGDRLRLRQVVDNLISNAVKFTSSGGHVSVRASHDDQFWRIDVQDEGIGIPADELGRLFGRFFRASNAVTSGTPGSGIGLSIVRTITELHGGHVEVASTVGEGTTFSAFVPVRR